MYDWDEEQLDVYNDLKDDGVKFVFVRRHGHIDPVSGLILDDFEERFETYGIVRSGAGRLALPKNRIWDHRFGDLVESGDEVVMIAARTYQYPQLGDETEMDGLRWKVVAVDNYRPGKLPLVCYILIRRA